MCSATQDKVASRRLYIYQELSQARMRCYKRSHFRLLHGSSQTKSFILQAVNIEAYCLWELLRFQCNIFGRDDAAFDDDQIIRNDRKA